MAPNTYIHHFKLIIISAQLDYVAALIITASTGMQDVTMCIFLYKHS